MDVSLTSVSALPSSAGARAVDSPQNRRKLDAAAREFESVLLGQWLHDAEASFGRVPGGDENTDPGGEQMQSLGTQQLAIRLAANGGIGLGRMVEKALIHTEQGKSRQDVSSDAQGVPSAAMVRVHRPELGANEGERHL